MTSITFHKVMQQCLPSSLYTVPVHPENAKSNYKAHLQTFSPLLFPLYCLSNHILVMNLWEKI